MIYRAFVCSTAPNWKQEGGHSYYVQRTVFFEAGRRKEAAPKLKRLMAALWEVPEQSLDIENLYDEIELAEQAFGDTSNPDHSLFELGISKGKPIYEDGRLHPLFLVEENHRRLLDAYQSLPYYGEAPVTVVRNSGNKPH